MNHEIKLPVSLNDDYFIVDSEGTPLAHFLAASQPEIEYIIKAINAYEFIDKPESE